MDILLIDNRNLYLDILQRALGGYPEFQLHHAANAADGRKQLYQHDFQFIAISMVLPDANGLDLAREIRDFGKYIFEPIVLLTVNPSIQLNRDAAEAGVTEVFRRQDISELIVFLQRFLSIYAPLHGKLLYIEDNRSQRMVMQQQL